MTSRSAGERSSRSSNPSGGTFDTSELAKEIGVIDEQLSQGDVWSDQERAADLNRRRSTLVSQRDRGDKLRGVIEDAETLLLLEAEGEENLDADFEAALEKSEAGVSDLEVTLLLSGEDDHRNAYISIHPGAGGIDAQDWAEMLMRMYQRWAERAGYEWELQDYLAGDGAGIKSATARIVGADAYGWARAERGVHRLVRISPFDAQSRRHTAFASVDVTAEVDDTILIEILDKDLRVDTFRSSGAGGQHVNVTDSAVRITHLPTNIVVSCQDERSQHRNREKAMRMLRSKLYEKAVRERDEALAIVAGDKKDIDFGSQIRSYVLAPYRLVKDHRTGHETGDVDRVLDGALQGFMKAWLLSRASL